MAFGQKKLLPPTTGAAKGKAVELCFILILAIIFAVFLPLASTAASNRQAVQETLDIISEALDTAEPIYLKLKEIIAEEIAALDVEDDSEPDLDEAEASYEEIIGYTAQLDGLISGLSGLNGDPDTSEGKTLLAARQYLNMLRNMSADFAELVRYSIDMLLAVEPLGMMYLDTFDFMVLSEQIWNGCESTRVLMEKVRPPAYLTITHNDMLARITEFRDFGEDFYNACYMEDPLRIYSCVYRMNRIVRMFDICGENLNADLEVQLKQAERRLNDPIAQLRSELTKNLETLKNAQGRGQ